MTDSDPITHDVFISYSRDNRDWVVEELQPQLEAANLSVLRDEESFELGIALAENVVNAVKRSRHVVAVVTEQWLESPWTQYESWLQFTKDPTGKTSRLFALVFVPHEKLPPQIQSLTYAHCQTAEERGQAISRMLLQLGVSQQQIDESSAQTVGKGLAELRLLLKSPTVKAEIRGYADAVRGLRAEIKRLGNYKDLHDYFQQAEGDHKLLHTQLRMVKNNDLEWDDLKGSAAQMRRNLDRAQSLAGSFLTAAERTWSMKVKVGQESLEKGIENSTFGATRRPMLQIRDVMGQQLHRLNERLVEIAGTLNLGQLLETLETIRSQLEKAEFNKAALAQLTVFRQGITGLSVLKNSLDTLVTQHNVLQGLDDELRLYDFLNGVKHLPVDEIIADWQFIKEFVTELNGEQQPRPEWLTSLGKVRDKLSTSCVPGSDVTGDADAQRQIRSQFNGFNNAVSEGSNQVDTDLKNLCARLQQVGDELDGFLGDMTNGRH